MFVSRQRATIDFALDNLVWLILLVVLVVFSITIPNYFQIGIFANIVEQSTFVGTMAIGLSLIIIAGNIDLSVESTLALAAMVTGLLFATRGAGMGFAFTPEWLVIPISLAVALLVGAAVGATNAFFVVKLQMNAFIVTLASFIWVRGLVVAGTGNGTVHQALEAALLRAQALGLRIVRATRCAQGRVFARSDDVFPASDSLSPVKARIALMLELMNIGP